MCSLFEKSPKFFVNKMLGQNIVMKKNGERKMVSFVIGRPASGKTYNVVRNEILKHELLFLM